MKRLFLHIGFNKTGSTSLQRCLSQNKAALEQAGFLYPGAAQDSYVQNNQHTPLAAALPERPVGWLRPRKREGLKHALPDLRVAIEASPAETVILSSEAFGGLDMTTERVARVRDKLADIEIFIIAYIRRQDSYFLSTYQEDIKNGGGHPFAFKRYRTNRQFTFSQRLAPWREAFGAERVIVRPFDPRFWPEGRLEYDFLQTIGAPRDNIELLEKPANESLDIQTLEFLRQINLLSKQEQGIPLPLLKARRLTAAFSQLLDTGGDRQKMVLSSDQVETLRAYFRDDNIAALEGSGVAVDDFFSPAPPSRTAQLKPPNLDQEILLRLILAQQDQASS